MLLNSKHVNPVSLGLAEPPLVHTGGVAKLLLD